MDNFAKQCQITQIGDGCERPPPYLPLDFEDPLDNESQVTHPDDRGILRRPRSKNRVQRRVSVIKNFVKRKLTFCSLARARSQQKISRR